MLFRSNRLDRLGTSEAVETIARYEAYEGITAICPATLTLPVEELNSILAKACALECASLCLH